MTTQTNQSGGNYPLTLIFALILGILIVVFAIQNANPVNIKFIVWEVETALALVLLICITLGALLTVLLSIPGRLRTRKTIKNLNKEIKTLQEEIKRLNALKQPGGQSSSTQPENPTPPQP